ncbi:hypothetical protein, partial [Mycobacterium heckeshornense]|uniref:hypothetical protein n=1 Tax=Mycobacterium heckeshornense TaxID=110505 RepID=UPI0021F38C9E
PRAGSGIKTIRHAGYDFTAPANSGPQPRRHADCPVKIEEPLWRAAYDQWRADRTAWVAGGGEWPGGEKQRELQEAFAMPDEPWDEPIPWHPQY